MYVKDVLNASPGKLRFSVICDWEKVSFYIIYKKIKKTHDRIARARARVCVWGGGGDRNPVLHLPYS